MKTSVSKDKLVCLRVRRLRNHAIFELCENEKVRKDIQSQSSNLLSK